MPPALAHRLEGAQRTNSANSGSFSLPCPKFSLGCPHARKGPPRPLSQGAASPVVQSSRILVPAGCGYRKGCRIQGCPRLVLRTGGLHLSLLQGDVVNLTRTSSSGSKPAEMLSALTIHSFVCLTKTADADCRCVDFQHVDS